MKYVIGVLSEDKPGVLSRIATLIARRGYNVESLSVGRSHLDGFSRFTLVVDGDERVVDQIVKQLDKLIETVEVRNLSQAPYVERWIMLIKVSAPLEIRPHVLQTAEAFRGKAVDVGGDALVFEVTGDKGKVEAFLAAMRPFGILEVASSGAVAMQRVGFERNIPGREEFELKLA
ncbi:acetolactate synthase small subunit [Acetomicrobium flavidum]|uniref:Acetolactate synthase small subunit n=1 Tax=Acetomicrobium mobile (strain ATCC BAA-54 / DSM 13181 / JCM 12221 / NGA) TaxID=891968 RepID=I4BU62_ACEMN|nr:acetolactate synthase small subunit [Acetomicrobium mobile]AFM20819.1 acetolactate synthase, small subunit [Acetomicrobium mobile DSM 13181]